MIPMADKKNAEAIRRFRDLHDQLLEAAKWAVETYEDAGSISADKAIDRLKTAIAAAEEQAP